MHELPRQVLFDRVHERVGDRDRYVEVVPAPLRMLRFDEFRQVRVVAVEHGHLRAAARARAFDGAARRVEHVDVAARAGCARSGRAHVRAARADRGEVVADAAAAAHRFGGLQQRDVDAGQAEVVDALDAVADRLHEAVDQRRRDAAAGRAHDAAGTERAVAQVVEEACFHLLAQRRRLGGRDAARDAAIDVVGGPLVALGVLFEHHVDRELLRSELKRGRVDCHDELVRLGAGGRARVGGIRSI